MTQACNCNAVHATCPHVPTRDVPTRDVPMVHVIPHSRALLPRPTPTRSVHRTSRRPVRSFGTMAFNWLEDDLAEDLFRDAPKKIVAQSAAATPTTPDQEADAIKAAFEAQKKKEYEAYLAALQKLQARAVRPEPTSTVYYKHPVSPISAPKVAVGGAQKRIMSKLRVKWSSAKARVNPKSTLAALTRKVHEDAGPAN